MSGKIWMQDGRGMRPRNSARSTFWIDRPMGSTIANKPLLLKLLCEPLRSIVMHIIVYNSSFGWYLINFSVLCGLSLFATIVLVFSSMSSPSYDSYVWIQCLSLLIYAILLPRHPCRSTMWGYPHPFLIRQYFFVGNYYRAFAAWYWISGRFIKS